MLKMMGGKGNIYFWNMLTDFTTCEHLKNLLCKSLKNIYLEDKIKQQDGAELCQAHT